METAIPTITATPPAVFGNLNTATTTTTSTTSIAFNLEGSIWVPSGATVSQTENGTARYSCPVIFGTQVSTQSLASYTSTPEYATSYIATAGEYMATFSCSYTVWVTGQSSEATLRETSVTTTTLTETAAAQAPPNPAKRTGHGGQSPVSKAVAAGIGVGAGVLGILLGLAAAAFCLYRRKRGKVLPENDAALAAAKGLDPKDKPPQPLHPPTPPPKPLPPPVVSLQQEESLAAVGSTSTAAGFLDIYELKGLDDSKLAEELSSLGHIIQDHVENNYHLGPIDLSTDDLSQFLASTGLDESNRRRIATLSLNPQTRYGAIRHTLALVLFPAVDFHLLSHHSLLPRGVTAFLRSLPSKSGGSRREVETDPTALTVWRRLSVYLLHGDPASREGPLPLPTGITSQIESLQASLDGFLACFVHRDSRAVFDQGKNLEGVMHECATFGYTLFSHPCEWQIDMAAGEAPRSVMLVVPGLKKLSDQQGQLLEKPREVVAPRVLQV